MTAQQRCWHCGLDVGVDELVWLDAAGLPAVFEKDSLIHKVARPASPAAYHPACGEAFRAARLAVPAPVSGPAPVVDSKGQMGLF